MTATSTVVRALGILRGVLELARPDGVITDNPATDVDLTQGARGPAHQQAASHAVAVEWSG